MGNFNHVLVESDSSLVVNLFKGQQDDTLHGLLLICLQPMVCITMSTSVLTTKNATNKDIQEEEEK